jgi:hypothetical protein
MSYIEMQIVAIGVCVLIIGAGIGAAVMWLVS